MCTDPQLKIDKYTTEPRLNDCAPYELLYLFIFISFVIRIRDRWVLQVLSSILCMKLFKTAQLNKVSF